MRVLPQSAPRSTRLLAIDTACDACSVAFWEDGAVISSCRREMARGHAEALMPMVADTMGDAGAEFGALDLIAATIGPGSFTGLRTGLAAARGFALSLSIPLIGVTSTHAIAIAALRSATRTSAPRAVTVVINSRRADLYVQHFDAAHSPLGDPYTAFPEEIMGTLDQNGLILAGDATAQVMDLVSAEGRDLNISVFPVTGPDAVFVAEVAASRWRNRSMGEKSFPNELLYLRAPEAVKPPAQGRLRQ